jgi:hypothetical protein
MSKMPRFKKLSSVLAWAEKHLKQGTGYLYNADDGTYCTMGAIGKAIGISDSELQDPTDETMRRIWSFDSVDDFNQELRNSYKMSISELNDYEDWSFADFKRVAKKWGH